MAERLGIDNLEFEKKHPVGVVHPLRIISKLPVYATSLQSVRKKIAWKTKSTILIFLNLNILMNSFLYSFSIIDIENIDCNSEVGIVLVRKAFIPNYQGSFSFR